MKFGAALLATLLLSSCDIGGDTQSNAVRAGIVPDVTPQAEPRPVAPQQPANIYYDLTRFDWYARGEPLVDDSVAFTPGGVPVALPLAELERVGDYQGVDIYQHRSAADRDAVRYVPVYEGFWLRFTAQPTQVVEPD